MNYLVPEVINSSCKLLTDFRLQTFRQCWPPLQLQDIPRKVAVERSARIHKLPTNGNCDKSVYCAVLYLPNIWNMSGMAFSSKLRAKYNVHVVLLAREADRQRRIKDGPKKGNS